MFEEPAVLLVLKQSTVKIEFFRRALTMRKKRVKKRRRKTPIILQTPIRKMKPMRRIQYVLSWREAN